MKKRLRKKISKKYINHEIIVTSIKEIESDYNYIVYFQTLDNLKNFQVQILKYMENYKYIATLKLCAIKQSVLKGYELKTVLMHLYIPKYQIKAIDSRMCLCHCVSGKDFKKTVERK